MMDNSLMLDQVVIAGIATWLIQKAKAWSGLPAVQQGATKAVRVFASIVALLSASGILVTTNWVGAEGTFSLAITGISAGNITLFLWTALKSIVFQEGWFRLLKASQGGLVSLSPPILPPAH